MISLWQHQKDAHDYLKARVTNGLLIHGVGVGKTLTSLTYIKDIGSKLILIVGTKKGISVWRDQNLEHGFDFNVMTLNEGSVQSRALKVSKEYQSKHKLPLIITVNYEAFAREAMLNVLLNLPFDMIIFDEVHRLRGHTTKQSKAAFKLSQRHRTAIRIGLTGTIIYNKPLDVFGVYRFIDPSVFGTKWNNFKFRYAVWGGQFGQIPLYFINTEEIKQKVQTSAHIVDRTQVLDLPSEQHIERRTAFSSSEAKTYKHFDKEFLAYLEDRTLITATNILDKISKLQQLTSGFLYTPTLTTRFSSAKIELLESILEEVGDQNAVIFYRFKEEAVLIAECLVRLGIKYFSVSGQSDQYAEWRDYPQSAVLLTQIQSGSESIDLTKAAVTVFYSLIYSYGQYQQALGRTSRANQHSKSVIYYYLIIENSIDEKILSALKGKKDLIEDIVGARSVPV